MAVLPVRCLNRNFHPVCHLVRTDNIGQKNIYKTYIYCKYIINTLTSKEKERKQDVPLSGRKPANEKQIKTTYRVRTVVVIHIIFVFKR